MVFLPGVPSSVPFRPQNTLADTRLPNPPQNRRANDASAMPAVPTSVFEAARGPSMVPAILDGMTLSTSDEEDEESEEESKKEAKQDLTKKPDDKGHRDRDDKGDGKDPGARGYGEPSSRLGKGKYEGNDGGKSGNKDGKSGNGGNNSSDGKQQKASNVKSTEGEREKQSEEGGEKERRSVEVKETSEAEKQGSQEGVSFEDEFQFGLTLISTEEPVRAVGPHRLEFYKKVF